LVFLFSVLHFFESANGKGHVLQGYLLNGHGRFSLYLISGKSYTDNNPKIQSQNRLLKKKTKQNTVNKQLNKQNLQCMSEHSNA